MKVILVNKEDWKQSFSRYAHEAAFGKIRDPEHERIDYALLAINGAVPVGYATVRELDRDTAYWPYGGVFPQWHGTPVSNKVFETCLCKQGTLTKRLRFLVERKNFPMLRIALKKEFLVTGLRVSGEDVFVELEKEFS